MVSPLPRIRVSIQGRVQGVGYRYFVQHRAQAKNLTGYVRNEWDGSVTVEAQGSQGLLHNFLQELQSGPRLAMVEKIKVQALEPVVEEKDFQIVF